MGLKIRLLIALVRVRLFKIKQLFNSKARQKRKNITINTESYRKEVEKQLCDLGYANIKKYSLSTWKYYGVDRVRLTFLAARNGKKYVIKVTKGFEDKLNNSIRFHKRFNDEFSFIPKGDEIKLTGYVGYETEYIPSYPFSLAKYIIDKSNVAEYLKQVNSILDQLAKYSIVHCDLDHVNLLISKKDRRLYIIDWDTCCSDVVGLYCQHFPAYTIKRKAEDDRFIYDDAFSFCTLFRRLGIDGLENIEEFSKLTKKVDTNIHIADN